MSCTSKMIQKVYGESKFKCSATKAAAIVSGVFEPMIIEQIENELEKAFFVTISTDASNHKELKMFPILIRYFVPTEGVKTRLIELKSLSGETGEQIVEMLKDAWLKWKFQKKIIAYCADNAPLNFGSVDRKGDKNVFARLQNIFGDILIGLGCLAHICHNAPHDACLANIPYDFNQILTLIHKQFNTSTKQTEALKQFCEEMDVEFRKVKSCPNTRFIAKKDSINSVLRVIEPLQSYFTSNPSKNVPLVLRTFFKDPLHKFYLVLVRDLCEMFEHAILKIEGDDICGNEAIKIVENLQSQLQKQIDESFISIETERALHEASEMDLTVDEANTIERIAFPLYRKFD